MDGSLYAREVPRRAIPGERLWAATQDENLGEADVTKPDSTIEDELWSGDQANTAHEERAARELARRRERIAQLEAALRAVHPEHPQPEICSACAVLGRTKKV